MGKWIGIGVLVLAVLGIFALFVDGKRREASQLERVEATKRALKEMEAAGQASLAKITGGSGDTSGRESDLEKSLTFKCAQEWREAKVKGYGLSYLSTSCREEYDKATKVPAKQ